MRGAMRGGVCSRQNGRVEVGQGLGVRPASASTGGVEATGDSQGRKQAVQESIHGAQNTVFPLNAQVL